MITRFDTYEQAALFAARMRSQGFYSELYDDAGGLFWGTFVSNGVRVVTSEESVDESDQVPAMEHPDSRLLRILRLILVPVAVIGGLAFCFFGAWRLLEAPVKFLGALILVGGFLALVTSLSRGLIEFIGAWRDPTDSAHDAARITMIAIAILLAIAVGFVGLG